MKKKKKSVNPFETMARIYFKGLGYSKKKVDQCIKNGITRTERITFVEIPKK